MKGPFVSLGYTFRYEYIFINRITKVFCLYFFQLFPCSINAFLNIPSYKLHNDWCRFSRSASPIRLTYRQAMAYRYIFFNYLHSNLFSDLLNHIIRIFPLGSSRQGNSSYFNIIHFLLEYRSSSLYDSLRHFNSLTDILSSAFKDLFSLMRSILPSSYDLIFSRTSSYLELMKLMFFMASSIVLLISTILEFKGDNFSSRIDSSFLTVRVDRLHRI